MGRVHASKSFDVPLIEEDQFLAGSRVLVALEKVGSCYFKNEFRKATRKFFQELAGTVLSAVVAQPHFGQGLGCFCHEIVIGGC